MKYKSIKHALLDGLEDALFVVTPMKIAVIFDLYMNKEISVQLEDIF